MAREARGQTPVLDFRARARLGRDGHGLLQRVDGFEVGACHDLVIDDSGGGETLQVDVEVERFAAMPVDGE